MVRQCYKFFYTGMFDAKMLALYYRPRGPMDKASDFESEDCGFDPHRGQFYLATTYYHENATR